MTKANSTETFNEVLNLQIDASMKNKLKELAIRDGRTLSSYIRMLFNKHLESKP